MKLLMVLAALAVSLPAFAGSPLEPAQRVELDNHCVPGTLNKGRIKSCVTVDHEDRLLALESSGGAEMHLVPAICIPTGNPDFNPVRVINGFWHEATINIAGFPGPKKFVRVGGDLRLKAMGGEIRTDDAANIRLAAGLADEDTASACLVALVPLLTPGATIDGVAAP